MYDDCVVCVSVSVCVCVPIDAGIPLIAELIHTVVCSWHMLILITHSAPAICGERISTTRKTNKRTVMKQTTYARTGTTRNQTARETKYKTKKKAMRTRSLPADRTLRRWTHRQSYAHRRQSKHLTKKRTNKKINNTPCDGSYENAPSNTFRVPTTLTIAPWMRSTRHTGTAHQ